VARKIEKIRVDMNEARLQEDLKKYRQKALELGASQAAIVKTLEGKKCRFSLRSRPSMEAVGIDVYQMVARAGWDIYPIGSDDKPEDIPKGTLAGLIIVQ
jgi:hypothetical protein